MAIKSSTDATSTEKPPRSYRSARRRKYVVAWRAGRPGENVELAGGGIECQDLDAPQRRRIGHERHGVRHPLETRVQPDEHLAEGIEVRAVCGKADVEVESGSGRAVKHAGNPADHDEVDSARDEALEDLVGAQLSAPRAGHV